MTTPDLDRWLKQATHGLTADEAADIRDELRWHYEDSRADFIAEGMSPQAAHRAAMASLGAADDVGAEFREIRFIGTRYLLVALLGLIYPPLHFLTIQFNIRVAGSVIFNMAIFLALLYVVYGFKTLLKSRPHGIDIRLYEQIIHTGIAVTCVPRLVAWLLYDRPMLIEAYTVSLWEAASTTELLLNVTSLLGLFIITAGLLMLGEHALRLHESLFGMLKPAGGLMIICGLSTGAFAIGTMMGSSGISELAETIIAIAGMCAVVLWSVIFFRARGELLSLA